MLGFDIAKGTHELKFTYKARGLSKGVMMTVIGLIVLLVYILLSALRKKKKASAQTAQPGAPEVIPFDAATDTQPMYPQSDAFTVPAEGDAVYQTPDFSAEYQAEIERTAQAPEAEDTVDGGAE